jgi:hypothetical protein
MGHLTETELKPFQFITRVDPSAPLINKGTLAYCVKRLNKKLKMRPETEQEIIAFIKLKTIRDELRKLKNEL